MPKIIPDLGPRILQTAARHFETKGFEGSDMKTLAAELGISVGTLYNYYPSKPELFLAVSLLWKQQLSQRLISRLESEDTPQARLRATLLMIYDDMAQYTGIWKEFIRSAGDSQKGPGHGEKFKDDNERLYMRLQGLFQEVWKGHPNAEALVNDPKGRLAQLMFGSIMHLVMAGGEDPLATREFVIHWINFVAPDSPAA